MSTLAEIEAALPMLSAEELARVEVTVHRLQRERGAPVHPEGADARFDGRPWPKTVEEIAALLADLDALPPLLTAQDADRFEAWRVEEKERQKSLSGGSGLAIGQLFSKDSNLREVPGLTVENWASS